MIEKIRNEDDRRRYFALYGLFTGISVCLIQIILILPRGNRTAIVLNLSEAGILFFIFLISRRMKNKRIIYFLGLLTLSLLLLTNIYRGEGGESSLIWALILPLVYIFYRGVRRGTGWVIAFLVILIPSLFNLLPFLTYRHNIPFSTQFLIAYAILTSLSISLEYSRSRHQHYQEEKNRKLQAALDEIEFLQEIIPICSYCKKVRDDKGYWDQVDKYLSRHGDFLFSHSICPDCLREQFPEKDN